MSKPRRNYQAIDGIMLLDKDLGLSSNQALQKVRHLFNAAKAGHTGTLDPLASGLLPLCFGEATKFSADLTDADKTYEAEIQLGVITDSCDREGKILATSAVRCALEQVESVLPRFRGQIQQIPPMHSALKRDGQPLYKLARQGVEVEREARTVVIKQLDVLNWSFDLQRLTCRVVCSKGTYIRALARDLGEMLSCGAHLSALRRTQVGDLCVANALTLEKLTALSDVERLAFLLPVDSLLTRLIRIDLSQEESVRFAHGNPVSRPEIAGQYPDHDGLYRVYADGDLLGVGQWRCDQLLWPKRLLQK